jgi:hypothetical protein
MTDAIHINYAIVMSAGLSNTLERHDARLLFNRRLLRLFLRIH